MGVFDSVGQFVSKNAGALATGVVATAGAAGAYIYADEIKHGLRRAGEVIGLVDDEEEEESKKAKKKRKAKAKKKAAKKAEKQAAQIAEALAKGATKELAKLEKKMTPKEANKVAKAILEKAQAEAEQVKAEAAKATAAAMAIIEQADAAKNGTGATARPRVVARSSMAVPANKRARKPAVKSVAA